MNKNKKLTDYNLSQSCLILLSYYINKVINNKFSQMKLCFCNKKQFIKKFCLN